MTQEIAFEHAPDLRRIYAAAVLKRGHPDAVLPDVRVVRTGITIDPDNLVAFVRAIGFSLTDRLPLPYPHLLGFPLQMVVMSGDGFPLPLVGSVHIANTIRVDRPLFLGDSLEIAVWAERLSPHRKGRQVDLVTEVRTRGEVAWRGVSTYLARGEEHPDAVDPQPPELEVLEQVRSGPVWRVPEGTGRRFAAIGGDWNPIHLHALTARAFGFPTAIAHGMYSYSRVVASLEPRLPEVGLTSRIWFRKPVRLPSTMRLRTAFEPRRAVSILESVKGDLDHAVIEHTW